MRVVFTAADLNPDVREAWHAVAGKDVPDTPRPPLADGEVKFVGDPVALVVADSRYIAEDAIELVDVDYEPLPAIADFTTAVKYGMGITHVLLDNGELAKISREQVAAIHPVWQTSLVNPDFAEYAELCGGAGFSVRTADELVPALEAALAVTDRPSLVAIQSSNRDV